MRARTPRLRASYALRTSKKRRILFNMENFPTPKLSAVPSIANVLTLVCLAGTTWWSSAQRPLLTEPSVALHAAQPATVPARQAAAPAAIAAPAARAGATTVGPESLLSVSFTGASVR